jgi:hypothetical protein
LAAERVAEVFFQRRPPYRRKIFQLEQDIDMALPKKILKKKYAESFCVIMRREHPNMTEAIDMETVFFFFNAGIEVNDAVNKYMEVEN